MVQFNLLPDVKLQFIKARRLKRLITTVCLLAIAGFIAITSLLYVYVNVAQSKHLKDLSRDTTKASSELKNTKDLDKILTIQNQLRSLPALHDQKPVTSRLFGYARQFTPANITIASIGLDFEAQTISFTGSSTTLADVNQFVDTIKFTNYKLKDAEETKPAFSEVVLTSFNRDSKGATYTVNIKYDPIIFDGTNDVSLVVPTKVTTRSETEKPDDALFKPLTTPVAPTTTDTTKKGTN